MMRRRSFESAGLFGKSKNSYDYDDRRGGPKSTRFLKALPALLLALFFLVYCLIDGGALWFAGFLYIRDKSFDKETVTRLWFAQGQYEAVSSDVEIQKQVALLLEPLKIVEDSAGNLTGFANGRQAVSICRDAILCEMLRSDYAYYAGNSARTYQAQDSYKSWNLVVFIPEKDLETQAYRLFGGRYSMKHQSGECFTYLPGAKGYTTAVQLSEKISRLMPVALEETEHTFRLTIQASGTLWRGIYVKRADGTVYLDALIRA